MIKNGYYNFGNKYYRGLLGQWQGCQGHFFMPNWDSLKNSTGKFLFYGRIKELDRTELNRVNFHTQRQTASVHNGSMMYRTFSVVRQRLGVSKGDYGVYIHTLEMHTQHGDLFASHKVFKKKQISFISNAWIFFFWQDLYIFCVVVEKYSGFRKGMSKMTQNKLVDCIENDWMLLIFSCLLV